ncbi:hmg-i/hmg-y, DNA-binding protein [Niveomyces insectorum RCEF 264]|uniref:Hmg-i/hmg-y, DNA-binding protein n=1 Tax=Niveomyces insectorum RCEF 264 TaxID=1081102 RepID=A0A167ZBP6_9HYPO|nr:hmg-i/hmg-y, DNA-binding protein [Niveomyces insectorum RCEF 264]
MGRNWKEVGEVPDSDDEALDTQDSLGSQKADEDATTADIDSNLRTRETPEDSIWDVPSTPQQRAPCKPVDAEAGPQRSSADVGTPLFTGPAPAQPASFPPAVDPDDEIDLLRVDALVVADEPKQTSRAAGPSQVDGRQGPPQPQQQEETGWSPPIGVPEKPQVRPQLQIDISSAPVEPRPVSPASSLSSLSSLSSISSPMQPHSPRARAQAPEVPEDRAPSPFAPVPFLPDSPPTFRLGFVRSLRPRKPIQQHPYLLENAQYTRFMKSHGVKPIRVAYTSAPTNPTAEEDSQEQEFVEEEIQRRGRDEHSGSARSEEDPFNFPSSSVDRDVGLVQSSLSPRTATPVHRLLPSSGRNSGDEETDNTSPDEDEFPSPKTFMLRRRRRLSGRSSGRQTSPQAFPRVKRAKTVQSAPRETTPSLKWKPVRMDSSPGTPLGVPGTEIHTSTSLLENQQVTIDIFDEDDDGDGEQGDGDVAELEEPPSPPRQAGSEDRSDSEDVRKISRRIRGVLPASWLRLDQQNARGSLEKPAAGLRRPVPQTDQAPRKGVALPRHHTPTSSATLAFMFDELDDDNDDDHDDAFQQPRASTKRSRIEPWPDNLLDDEEGDMIPPPAIDDEDIGSVMEDDVIDRMAPGAKRNRTSSGENVRVKRQRTGVPSNLFEDMPGRKARQPKITHLLDRTHKSSSSTASKRQAHKSHLSNHRPKPPRRTADRVRAPSSPPPRLSILDYAERTAPNFIRVAARTAKSRRSLGKTSPTHKMINLGNRNDNVDALSVLHDWKAKKIKPRVSDASARERTFKRRQPLQELSPNLAGPSVRTSNINPPTLRGTDPSELGQRTATLKLRGPVSVVTLMRPAQLETRMQDKPARSGFVAKKRALDEMYRKKRKDGPVLPDVRLERYFDDQRSVPDTTGCMANDEDVDVVTQRPGQERQSEFKNAKANAPVEDEQNVRRSRFRKRYDPKPVDTTAPRFVHALDPIPLGLDYATQKTRSHDNANPEAGKLNGLGPFGSQYPLHFDVFPLDSGVYFHQSTLLGSGRLARALDSTATSGRSQPPPTKASTFQLDERTLHWDIWNDTASSELGILFDWLADVLFPAGPTAETHIGPKIHNAVYFVADFIETIIAAPNVMADTQKSFVLRCLEVVTGFIDRFETSSMQIQTHYAAAVDAATSNSHLAALTGILLVAVWLLQICRKTSACLTEAFQVEETLKRIATLSVQALLKRGLGEVRAAYDDCQRPAFRERGIRKDMQALGSWVVLMQSLEYAQIPRAGFWDVSYSVMLNGAAVDFCTDAGRLEQLWEDMFVLLPLGEFDSVGVLQPGIRHLVPFDGWTLPRQALSRVFQLYKANPRQSPSFNAYCRAVVARCHYLVQEWGWRRCSSIIGVIFDFYGSQDFAHLRNEEVYKSPRFLDELAGSPSLDIDPDDKCFHIFIKMLGLVILRLRRLGLTNEMRNLIARTLPNHNRQYFKERDIHQRDLAALRNHHDLLCTLFWAAPSELRPAVHLIEKLVVPANSHKEACLINIRAWNQLARFVIATEEDYNVYRPFSSWMSSIFQQTQDQYLSAEADLQKQFATLPETMMQNISPDFLRAMAASNKAATMDVLHACVVSCLDVVRHAKSLKAATYCLSTFPLERVFTKLDLPSPKTSWSILCTALDVVDHFMDRLEKSMDEQYSNSSADAVDPHETEEAILMLDNKLTKDFFRFSNVITHTSWDSLALSASHMRVGCTERCVVLSARLISRFIHAGMYRLSRFFGFGDYCLFERLPDAPGLLQRKTLPLFVSALVQNSVFDFKDLGTSILELWMLALVKPQQFLAYEIRLATTLQHHDLPYLRRAFVPAGDQVPSYDTNRAFFACAVTSMRQQLRDADSAARRQQLRSDFARALKQVMQQMKEDLNYAKVDGHDDPALHGKFVGFVRSIVALIKSHGGDICPLDPFYYQQSQHYSPSPEDPQLQTAGVVAYGLRLGEGEATAAPQLFHYLHNNFNIALANDQLGQECMILERSLENKDVLGFMLERMLPAILAATTEVEDAWPLLDVYCNALQRFLTRSCMPKDIGDANTTGPVVGFLEDAVAWLQRTRLPSVGDGSIPVSGGDGVGGGGGERVGTREAAPWSCVQVHAAARLAALVNALQPFLLTCLCLPCFPSTRSRLEHAIGAFGRFVDTALRALQQSRSRDGDGRDGETCSLFSSASFERDVEIRDDSGSSSRSNNNNNNNSSSIRNRAQVTLFGKTIARHVRENWTVGNGYIAAQKAGKRVAPPAIMPAAAAYSNAAAAAAASAATPSGIPYGPWTMNELLNELERQLRLWNLPAPRPNGSGSRVRRLFPGRRRGENRCQLVEAAHNDD